MRGDPRSAATYRLQSIVARMWALAKTARSLTGELRDVNLHQTDRIERFLTILEYDLAALIDDVQGALIEQALERREHAPPKHD